MVLVNAGTVHLMAGDRARARQAFEAALDLDDGVARAHNGLGVIAAREGRLAGGDRALAAGGRPRPRATTRRSSTSARRCGGWAGGRRRGRTSRRYLRTAPVALEARDIARVRAWLGRAAG